MRFSSCAGGIARRVFANLRHPNLKLCDPALPDRASKRARAFNPHLIRAHSTPLHRRPAMMHPFVTILSPSTVTVRL